MAVQERYQVLVSGKMMYSTASLLQAQNSFKSAVAKNVTQKVELVAVTQLYKQEPMQQASQTKH